MALNLAKLAAVSVLLSGPMTEAAAERYNVHIVRDPANQWLGVAELASDPEGNVRGEICIVPKEFATPSASPRSLLRIPVSGRIAGNALALEVPPVAGGPLVENGRVELGRTMYHEPLVAPDGVEGWEFGSDQVALDTGDDPAGPGQSVRYMLLTRAWGPAPGAQLSVLSAARDDQVEVRMGRNEDAPFGLVSLGVYDGFSREEAMAFEQGHQREMHYPTGAVLAIVDSANLGRLQAALDALGDGARIMNQELRDCPPTPLLVTVAVPPLLEFWYTRRLQKTGLVVTAYPEGLERDSGWTAPIQIVNASVAAAFGDSRVATAEKYRRLWGLLDLALARFANVRRPGFTADGGTIARRGGQSPFVYVAEITGRALAVCQANRWERITVQAAIGGVVSAGRIDVSLQLSDGFFARGANPPSDSRFQDNRIADAELERLVELLSGAMESNSARGVRCQQ